MASPGKIDASQLTGGRRLPQIPKELEGHVLVNQQHRRIIVAEAKRNEPMVLSFLAQARMLSRNAGDPPPHVVYGEYEELEQERRSAAHVVEIDSAMQNRARNLFREAARAGVSDIHIKVVNEHTEVLCRLHGLLQPWGKYRMSDMEGRALCRTIYASMADPGAA
ncbi:MAG TPA: hypothetical protein VFA48_06810, partial [Gammaproteobacteria bacterium]|nr:hypothetical protein [Gammaproteobacteria bacterium]